MQDRAEVQHQRPSEPQDHSETHEERSQALFNHDLYLDTIRRNKKSDCFTAKCELAGNFLGLGNSPVGHMMLASSTDMERGARSDAVRILGAAKNAIDGY